MQNDDFQRDGFRIARGLFSPEECRALNSEIARLLDQYQTHGGVFVGLAAISSRFASLRSDPRLLDLLVPVLGPDVEFLSDKVVFKNAVVDFGSPWHQDWPYWKGLAHKVSVWVALDPATRENGCLKLLPGSHLTEVDHNAPVDEGEAFIFRLAEVDESRAVVFEAEPGDAVLFHDLTLHASFPNISCLDRRAFITTYRSASEPDWDYPWSTAKLVVRGKRTAPLVTAP